MKRSRPSTTQLLTAATLIAASFLLSACSGSSKKATPTVSFTYPAPDAISVPVNHKITATFSVAMNPDTIDGTTFTVAGDGEPALIGEVTLNADSNTATFAPTSALTAGTEYTASISTEVRSTRGKALASEYVWTFTSGNSADLTAPTVILRQPADGVDGVVLNTTISATFSESVNRDSVNESSFTLAPSANLAAPVSGTVTLNDAGTVVTFTPEDDLDVSTQYTATVTTGVIDNAVPGNALVANSVWTFETGVAVSTGPAPVVLGTAGDFAILTKTGITNVPASAIVGNIGSSPITSAAIDVTCDEISGTIYGANEGYTGSGDITCFQGDSAANTFVAIAVLDMGAAYQDAAGRTTPDFTELHAGDLSGQTLVPGLYKWGTGVLISTDMTFDGGPGDVWIMQVAGDLTVESLASMTLAGGANAKNIFWQIGGLSGAIINTDAHIVGVLLVEKAITLATGTSVNGRLLSQTEVTLQQNDIDQPAP